ncbi:Bifunctional ligase/repressor BirA [Poriferisphaera corsica]|uniref:Bifunctional ligase/repressor BirA n=1 Tax=Poriferisphaera corsica TaxID=2528020 RepID=A0A517YYT2_9BACT|nr:biotin--[acetyl-CoA-carboxylase] ligase [Poriferisphaera corsica]QDU35384.1 Bifunctional ligase/repressor BirA [Poriferisphaera corsica]
MLVYHYDETDSTNTRAAELAREHVGEVIVVSAGKQTMGRGRMGRKWESPAGGAWFSVVWPSNRGPEEMGAAPLAVGMAVREVIAGMGEAGLRDRLRIKWPNDVLVGERKLVGILCEQVLVAGQGVEEGIGGSMILGVGINANVDVSGLGEDLRTRPTSLKDELGCEVNITKLIGDCGVAITGAMRELEVCGGLNEEARARIEGSLAWVGEEVRYEMGGKEQMGVLVGVDDGGGLLVEVGGKSRIRLESGEITKMRGSG